MAKKFSRARTKEDVETRELTGLWKAISVVRDIGESREKITLDVIQRIHKTIFHASSPEVAGKFRTNGQDVKKLRYIEPPPGRIVQEAMHIFWREFDTRVAKIPPHPKKYTIAQRKKWLNQVFDLAAWGQHQLLSIHPFCEGNGRTARLFTNLVLTRFGLRESPVNFEGENKEHYLDALHQIDSYQDYEPLKRIIARSVFNVYRKEKKMRST